MTMSLEDLGKPPVRLPLCVRCGALAGDDVQCSRCSSDEEDRAGWRDRLPTEGAAALGHVEFVPTSIATQVDGLEAWACDCGARVYRGDGQVWGSAFTDQHGERRGT